LRSGRPGPPDHEHALGVVEATDQEEATDLKIARMRGIHPEAALTASEISDRVLGVSQVETVPSATVQISVGRRPEIFLSRARSGS
jgi:hypothetical protein